MSADQLVPANARKCFLAECELIGQMSTAFAHHHKAWLGFSIGFYKGLQKRINLTQKSVPALQAQEI